MSLRTVISGLTRRNHGILTKQSWTGARSRAAFLNTAAWEPKSQSRNWNSLFWIAVSTTCSFGDLSVLTLDVAAVLIDGGRWCWCHHVSQGAPAR